MIDSRAWALIVAFLELSYQAIEKSEAAAQRYRWAVLAVADKGDREQFRNGILADLGAPE